LTDREQAFSWGVCAEVGACASTPALLKDFRSDAGLRAGLAALPPNAGAENVKTAVLNDVDRFRATHDPERLEGTAGMAERN